MKKLFNKPHECVRWFQVLTFGGNSCFNCKLRVGWTEGGKPSNSCKNYTPINTYQTQRQKEKYGRISK
jgi:hypothetical protein